MAKTKLVKIDARLSVNADTIFKLKGKEVYFKKDNKYTSVCLKSKKRPHGDPFYVVTNKTLNEEGGILPSLANMIKGQLTLIRVGSVTSQTYKECRDEIDLYVDAISIITYGKSVI